MKNFLLFLALLLGVGSCAFAQEQCTNNNKIYPTILSNSSTMAYVITDKCVACGTCQPVCPVEAISEGEIYHIDPDTCIECAKHHDECQRRILMAVRQPDRALHLSRSVTQVADTCIECGSCAEVCPSEAIIPG